ncbi:EI24 domain-containing protein [Candidatus Bathyarchaeota archaeon]|nr:EI24 domain-containing protein [Candidatus Bathyarchaeota archaeon]
MINFSFEDMILAHRVLNLEAPDAVKALGKPTSPAVYTPWSIKQMVELVVCLPLNLIPVVGTPAFILITGSRLGKLAHHRWFQLRGLDKKETKAEIRKRSWEYLWFGTVAMVLELIPVLSLFFLLTTTAGAAMLAARLEEETRRGQVYYEDDLEAAIPPPQARDNEEAVE